MRLIPAAVGRSSFAPGQARPAPLALVPPLLAALLAGCAAMNTGAPPAGPAAAASRPAAAASASSPGNGGNTARANPPAAAPPASGVPPGTPQPTTPPAFNPQPFATVIKDAKKTDGLFTLHQKDERVWLELRPEDFDKPFFLAPKLATGIGEAMLFGGLMDFSQVVEFRRVYNQVQLIAVNTDFVAKPGTPEGRAVAAAFSPSLLASTPVGSQPKADGSKAILVDANALFMNDMFGLAMRLQRAYRQNYAFDARNSAITVARGTPDAIQLEVMAHYATAAIAVPTPGSPPGAPVPTVPATLPDPRSMFMTLHYTLAKLPEQPMAGRAADARIGYFTDTQYDFGDDIARTPAVRRVMRWRLEKKDPAAPLSEPVKPIVYWLDRTIPLKYRDAIASGVLEWNKAFERIGFKDAIQVKVQPDDADFDTLDGGASIRWMTNSSPAFGAIGPSRSDPRSGEILGANIGFESLSSRNIRAARAQILNNADWSRLMQTNESGALDAAQRVAASGGRRADGSALCEVAEIGAEQLAYALDVLEARGVDPDGPQAQAFVLAYLKDTTMHEVGHTLGLRHNFRASRAFSDRQVSDPEFTRTHALTGSVMEYAPINLAAPGAPDVSPFQTMLGPYDYWAIEYAYKPIAPQDEKAELARIASRSAEPELAYGTDEDNFLGIDPEALMFDLGNDPLAFAKKRLAIARDLFKRQELRDLPRDQDYAVLRRSLFYALADVARSAGVLARQIGGVRTLRDHPGSGREPLQAVPAAAQRDALDALARGLFAADSLSISPTLASRLAPDFQERSEQIQFGSAAVQTEFALPQRVLGLQRALLNHLMSDTVAARILDNQGIAARGDAFQLSELYGRLDRDVWSELAGRASDIPAPRRELQREHLNRVAALLLRPNAASRVDTRSLVRVQAQALLARLQAAQQRPGWSADARAHLQDSADTLAQALSARLQRAGT